MKKSSSRLNTRLLVQRIAPVSAITILLCLSGCADTKLNVPKKIEFERSQQLNSASVLGDNSYSANTRNTPKLPSQRLSGVEQNQNKSHDLANEKSELTVSFDQMPLPTFIQAVYGSV
jgi:hypothetical protein